MKNIFSFKEEAELFKIGTNLANYIYTNEVKSVIFMDRSARPGYLALLHAWRQSFESDKTPDIYFTNPDAYQVRGSNLKKEVAKQFNSTYKRLAQNKDDKVMLFDTCVHSGETLFSVREIMDIGGYTNVSVGVAQAPHPLFCFVPRNKLDFVASTLVSCKPFDSDYLISKEDAILSERNFDLRRRDREHSISLRKEIADIFEQQRELKRRIYRTVVNYF